MAAEARGPWRFGLLGAGAVLAALAWLPWGKRRPATNDGEAEMTEMTETPGRTPKDAPEEAERIQKGKKGSVVITSLDELRTEQEQVAIA